RDAFEGCSLVAAPIDAPLRREVDVMAVGIDVDLLLSDQVLHRSDLRPGAAGIRRPERPQVGAPAADRQPGRVGDDEGVAARTGAGRTAIGPGLAAVPGLADAVHAVDRRDDVLRIVGVDIEAVGIIVIAADAVARPGRAAVARLP